jgi:hypothetical protein
MLLSLILCPLRRLAVMKIQAKTLVSSFLTASCYIGTQALWWSLYTIRAKMPRRVLGVGPGFGLPPMLR